MKKVKQRVTHNLHFDPYRTSDLTVTQVLTQEHVTHSLLRGVIISPIILIFVLANFFNFHFLKEIEYDAICLSQKWSIPTSV